MGGTDKATYNFLTEITMLLFFVVVGRNEETVPYIQCSGPVASNHGNLYVTLLALC